MEKRLKKKTFITYLIPYMILKPKDTLVRTLDSVKDGPIWEVKYISMPLDYITHVGDHQYCGRFYDMLTGMKRVDVGKKIK
jgi:hypothetical protein